MQLRLGWILFPVSTGINRAFYGYFDPNKSVPRKYGD